MTEGKQVRELTAIEYARMRGLSLDWVYRLCRLGKLNACRVDGKWRITPEPADSPTLEISTRASDVN